MSILKIHKIAVWTCLGLFLVGFLIGGSGDSYKQTEKGAKFMFMVGGIYLPVYCARAIYIGKMPLVGYPGIVFEKCKDSALFWSQIALYISIALIGITTPFR